MAPSKKGGKKADKTAKGTKMLPRDNLTSGGIPHPPALDRALQAMPNIHIVSGHSRARDVTVHNIHVHYHVAQEPAAAVAVKPSVALPAQIPTEPELRELTDTVVSMQKKGRKQEAEDPEAKQDENLFAIEAARARQELFEDTEVGKISEMFEHLMAQSRLNYAKLRDLSRKDGGLMDRVNKYVALDKDYKPPRAQEQLDNFNANPNHLVIFPKGNDEWPEGEVWNTFFPLRVFDMLAGQFPPEKADDPKWPAHPYGWPGEGGLRHALKKYVDRFLEQHAAYICILGPTTNEHILKFRQILNKSSNKHLRGYFAGDNAFPVYYIPILLGILRCLEIKRELKENPAPEEPEVTDLWTVDAMWRSIGHKFRARYGKQKNPEAREDVVEVLHVFTGSEGFAMDRKEDAPEAQASGANAIPSGGNDNDGNRNAADRSGEGAGTLGTQGNGNRGCLNGGPSGLVSEPPGSNTGQRYRLPSGDGPEPSSRGGNGGAKARGKK